MAQGNIDYDRGVTMRSHPTGVTVYMYIDEPGTFRNAFGVEVSDDLAREAGFDVEKLGKQKLRRERVAKAMEAIDADLAEAGAEKRTVASRAGFHLVDIGLGRFNVEDPEGNILNPTPLTEAQGRPLLDKIAPLEPTVKPKVAEKAPPHLPGQELNTVTVARPFANVTPKKETPSNVGIDSHPPGSVGIVRPGGSVDRVEAGVQRDSVPNPVRNDPVRPR